MQHPVHVDDFNSHEISTLVSKRKSRVAHTHLSFKTSQRLRLCFKQRLEEFGSPAPWSAWNLNWELRDKGTLALCAYGLSPTVSQLLQQRQWLMNMNLLFFFFLVSVLLTGCCGGSGFFVCFFAGDVEPETQLR